LLLGAKLSSRIVQAVNVSVSRNAAAIGRMETPPPPYPYPYLTDGARLAPVQLLRHHDCASRRFDGHWSFGSFRLRR
jgi:hypothetical protein